MACEREHTVMTDTKIRAMRGAGLLLLLLLCLALQIGGVQPAAAQRPTQAQTDAIRQSCRADYQAHCANVPTGGSAALACLQENEASLSPSCQHAVSAVSGGAGQSPSGSAATGATHAQPGQVRQACAMDYREYCRGIQPGGGRALACLARNQAALSPHCQEALAALRQAR
jgi:Cysteine rich repeat